MPKTPYLITAMSLLFAVTSTNCASQPPLTTKQKMDQIMINITQTIGKATCTNDQQCASIPIGAKPCGGPWSYRAYSTTHTDSDTLKQMTLQYKDLNKQYNKESGLMSDCSMIGQPTVACVKNTCEIKKQ